MAQVKFVVTDAAKYAALQAKDEGTLYFLSDTRQILRGSTPYGGGIYKAVASFPATDAAERNVLYVNTNTGAVKFFDGNAFVDVVLPKTTSLSASSTNAQLATAKSVVDYVTSTVANLETGKLADRVTAVENKAAANESAIGVINGTGDGSIKKAASDAQAAAIAAAATDATSKADAALAAAKEDATTKANAAQTAAEKTASDALGTAKTELNTAIGKKADKATTLAGYGITDAYTKTAADKAIADAVANAHHLKREIVDELPAVSAANADTIYMVPKVSGVAGNAAGNKYVEYMLIDGAFEQIGDSTVDLTDYATKAYAEEKATAAQNAAATDATTKANAAKEAAIAAAATDATTKANAAQAAAATDATTKADAAEKNAKSYADGLAKNYATAAQGKLADSALQAADVVEGKTNGTVSVKGTDVKVHGLGSAAYTASNAYATAAQGTKADSALQKADIASGSANGTISVKGEDVAVTGLGSAAYQASSAFDAKGTAATAETNAKAYADTKKTEAVDAAATDATTKANNALTSAKAYTDSALTWGTL